MISLIVHIEFWWIIFLGATTTLCDYTKCGLCDSSLQCKFGERLNCTNIEIIPSYLTHPYLLLSMLHLIYWTKK